jgi:hypothetical protein
MERKRNGVIASNIEKLTEHWDAESGLGSDIANALGVAIPSGDSWLSLRLLV